MSQTLETPWIVVIVLSVVLAMETVYIYFIRFRNQGAAVPRRRRTEYYDLQPTNRRHNALEQSSGTGFSPIYPDPAARAWRR